MKSNTRLADKRIGDKFDPALIEQELVNLKDEIIKPVTDKALLGWSSKNKIREFIFANTVWGSIRWHKSLGRPLGSPMANGFDIIHTHWHLVIVEELGRIQFCEILSPHPNLSKWDGADEKDYYTVNFMSDAFTGIAEHTIRVSFAAGVRWEQPAEFSRRGYRDIVPPLRVFTQTKSLTILAPFKVINKLI